MASETYTKNSLIGGITGCLDAIDGADLSDGDKAIVINSDGTFHYYLDASSGATEDSPDVISPDSNAGTKRWILASSDTPHAVYYPDADETDQGVTASGTGDTIYDIKTACGIAKYCKIVLRHTAIANTTSYNLDTNIDLSLYPYIYFEIQPGARLTRTTGDEVLTVVNPDSLIIPGDMQITAVDMIAFTEPGIVYGGWWGAVGDGATDDSTAIQIAIDTMADVNGGVVQLLGKTYAANNLELASFVILRGLQPGHRASHAAGVRVHNKTVLLANAANSLVGSPATALWDTGVININFVGLGTGTVVKGLYLDNVSRSTFRDLTFDNFSEQAIRIDEGVANEFTKIFAQNCLLDRSRSSKIGVIDIGNSTDNFFDKCEITPSLSALTTTDLYICAWAFSGALASTNMLTSCVGEFADIGFYVAGDWNGFSNCRADLNYGHGFELISGAGSNRFNNCFALRNSHDSDNTYDGFHIENGAAFNIFNGCDSTCLTTDAWQQRYGFYDATMSASNKNFFSGCIGSNNQTLTFKGEDYLGSSFTVNAGRQFSADDATPSVENGDVFWFATYTGATDLTDFDDGTPYQIIRIIDKSADGYITIKNNANIMTTTGADVTLTQNKFYSFIHDNGIWREF